MAQRSRELTASVADIGALPPVVNPVRKEACRYDLFLFLTTYFPNSTGLKPFSEDHRRVIERIQRCILEGGRFVNAVYRGFAKTTISENAALWATLYGHRRFVPIFGADQSAADGIIDSLKRELESNDLLLEDFPEVCYPVRALEGKSQRQHSQTHQGELTHVRWTADRIVFPTIAGSQASGSILCAHGLTSSIRGLKYKRPDGTQQRPDFAIIDDPQTDESAVSLVQVRKRLNIIKKTILKAGSHGKTLAVVINCTVIEPDDLVDQLLDHKKNPAWQGERIKLVRSWSKHHESHWLKDYAELRADYDKDDPGSQKLAHERATEFYRQHRDQMDDGCQVSWEHCFDPETEISATQHAYNALIDDGPEVFASEYQNEPLPQVSTTTLTAEEIASKINGYERCKVPQDAQKLTAFIDVQKDVLYYTVIAWAENFTGYIVDYGTFPDQKRSSFSLREVRYTLAKQFPGTGLEGSLFAGLKALTDQLCVPWTRDDGAKLAIERLLIDANWGDSKETVYNFCRQSPHTAILMPSHGMFIRAAHTFNQYRAKPGERRGPNWRIPPLSAGKVVRHAVFNANFWKSFIRNRLTTAVADPGSVSLFKGNHEMLADHLTSETPITVTAGGNTVEEFILRPSRDNHLLDCVVGCAVAASIQGVTLACHQSQPQPRKRRARVTYINV
jgi:hypothetical protein